MKAIHTRAELVELAQELGVRPDWHEPDEQEVEVRVLGENFDNAMGSGYKIAVDWDGEPYTTDGHPAHIETQVVLMQDKKAVAVVNLATLFAWATGNERG